MSSRSRVGLLVGILAALALTALPLAAVAFLGPQRDGGGALTYRAGCAAPALTGTVVNVAATDMGGPMMGGPGHRGAMRLTADKSIVPHGTVSFVLANAGRYAHELVILPLPGNQIAGTRPVGGTEKSTRPAAWARPRARAPKAPARGSCPGVPAGSVWTFRQDATNWSATSPATTPQACTHSSPSPDTPGA